jgi:hypothetical protein
LGAAIARCEATIGYPKREAPFRKKKRSPEGALCIDAGDSDEAAPAAAALYRMSWLVMPDSYRR